jgi:L-lactate dehydrogenase
MKIAIIGAGRVGSTIAYSFLLKSLASEIILVDVQKERCDGEVRDLADTLTFCQTSRVLQGTFEQARSADIIVISAGHAQQPGETRLDLYHKNKDIIASIMHNLEPLNPSAIIIMVTNPLDIMTRIAQQNSSLPTQQIFGTGTWLDTQRLRRYLGTALNVSPNSIDTMIIGEHGDAQCVVWSHTLCGGTPIADMGLTKQQLSEIAANARNEAYVIIEKKCGTYYGIAACVADICQTIIFDRKQIMPLSVYVPEYDVCLSVPVVLSAQGIERYTPMSLNTQEQLCLEHAAKKLKLLPSQPQDR